MKTFEFPCWASSGKCDSTDWTWDIGVSDKDAKRLEKAAKDGARLSEHSDLEDVYDRLYRKMLKLQAEIYLEDEDLLQEVIDDLELDEDDKVSLKQVIEYLEDYYSWGIDFPEVLCK